MSTELSSQLPWSFPWAYVLDRLVKREFTFEFSAFCPNLWVTVLLKYYCSNSLEWRVMSGSLSDPGSVAKCRWAVVLTVQVVVSELTRVQSLCSYFQGVWYGWQRQSNKQRHVASFTGLLREFSDGWAASGERFENVVYSITVLCRYMIRFLTLHVLLAVGFDSGSWAVRVHGGFSSDITRF